MSLENLVECVQAGDFPYEPLSDHKVYVPKPSATLRTMSLMSVQDLVVYQALVNVIADRSYQHLVTHEDQHVMGNVYAGPGKRWTLKPWKFQYMRFIERIESLFMEENRWIASTDIVAFYDTIDHERLLGFIRKYCGKDERFEGMLRKCLSKWSAHNPDAIMSRGIPQGTNASDFLANLFLHEIDREMIVHGYNYLRYVDDVRILGTNKSTVQHGLILFDLELKRAGLVAQVSKTSVHEIVDIEREINRLSFYITDPTGTGDGSYQVVRIPSSSKSEQAEIASSYVKSTPTEEVQSQVDLVVDAVDETELLVAEELVDIDQHESKGLQEQLRERFLEAFSQLDDPDLGKSSETSLTFCLYRLEPHEAIRDQILALLPKLPWRSDALMVCLSRFKEHKTIEQTLREFVNEHDVYSWHRAKTLWALYNVVGAKKVVDICREWLSDPAMDWYARVVAARILREVPTQHAYLMECLRYEQNRSVNDGEETAILRQELAYGAFQRIRSHKKQLTVFSLICTDKSPLLHRLAVYLLQQPACNVTWEDISEYHNDIAAFSGLVRALGISSDAQKPCFIAQTLRTMYNVGLPESNLSSFYKSHYNRAVEHLRCSVSAFHTSPSTYVRTFHQFAHLSLIAFYEYAFPDEDGLYSGYAALTDRKIFSETMPLGLDTWKHLGTLRNRVDHPIDKRTRTHSEQIRVKEVEYLHKQLQIALLEFFDGWLGSSNL